MKATAAGVSVFKIQRHEEVREEVAGPEEMEVEVTPAPAARTADAPEQQRRSTVIPEQTLQSESPLARRESGAGMK
jgi:hypothetical protein